MKNKITGVVLMPTEDGPPLLVGHIYEGKNAKKIKVGTTFKDDASEYGDFYYSVFVIRDNVPVEDMLEMFEMTRGGRHLIHILKSGSKVVEIPEKLTQVWVKSEDRTEFLEENGYIWFDDKDDTIEEDLVFKCGTCKNVTTNSFYFSSILTMVKAAQTEEERRLTGYIPLITEIINLEKKIGQDFLREAFLGEENLAKIFASTGALDGQCNACRLKIVKSVSDRTMFLAFMAGACD